MKTIKLDEKTQKFIEKNVGLSIDRMIKMDATEIDSVIETKNGKKLKPLFSFGNSLIPRGSVYLYLRRIVSLRFINWKLSRI